MIYVLEFIREMKYKASICLDFNKAFDIAPYGKPQVRLEKIKISRTTKCPRF